jgi:hypothetical protein
MKRLRALFCTALLLAPGINLARDMPDKILASRTFAGMLQGFRWGDYLHAELVDENGKSHSLFVNDVEACFMAQHATERLTIQYNEVSRYFEQGGGYFPANDVVQITAGKANFKTWKKSFNAKRDFDRCEALIEKHTLPDTSD